MRTTGRSAITCVLIALIVALASARASARELTMDDRVAAQRAIEQVYWKHRIWPKENPGPKPPLSAMMSDAAIRAKVEDYLRMSTLLGTYWHQPINGDQLQAELVRMTQQSKSPGTLRELFAALNDDPFLIAECLARPSLAQRRVNVAFANDMRIHGAKRDALASTLRGIADITALSRVEGDHDEITFVLDEGGTAASPKTFNPSDRAIRLNRAEWDREIAELAARFGTRSTDGPASIPVGRVSSIVDDGDRFSAFAVRSKDATRITVASITETKRSYFDWSREATAGAALDARATAAPVRGYKIAQVPLVACTNDTWAATGGNVPEPRFRFTSVWTGSEMIIWGGETLAGGRLSTGGRYDPATDSWAVASMNSGSGANVPSRRTEHTAVWTGSEMIIWGGVDAGVLNTGGRYDPLADSWSESSLNTGSGPNTPAGRHAHAAVWTGSEMIVWGGSSSSANLNTGGRYDPATDTWAASSLNTASGANVPETRVGHTAVWTGSEMIVWGGQYTDSTTHYLNNGGRYNPTTDSWAACSLTTGSGANVPQVSQHSAVWTGSEMIVWGGVWDPNLLNTGARYNPVSDSWVATSVGTNVPSARFGHTAVWTGSEMIVWGGVGGGNTGGRYNPAADTWAASSLTTGSGPSTPSGRNNHTAIWTGSEMIVWGGYNGTTYLNTGGRYNPVSDSWAATNVVGPIVGRQRHTAIWTGAEMIVWGGMSGEGGLVNTGERYDPATDTWATTSLHTGSGANVPGARFHHAAVWTGSEMIVWGGYGTAGVSDTGGRYSPLTDSWPASSLNTGSGANVPDGAAYVTAVWTGSEMIVWGGYGDAGASNRGGRFSPASDSWAASSLTTGSGANVPDGRAYHTAVWTGSEMIVWGGASGTSYFNTGGRYNPSTDSWAASSLTTGSGPNAPLGRTNFASVWTGTEMILWGGETPISYANTGGRYNPSTDSWAVTSLTTGSGANVPVPRQYPSGVWTGSEMIVWGGVSGLSQSTGGRYSPYTDAWSASSLTTGSGANVPAGRYWHTALWSGSEMIVWGGASTANDRSVNSGGRYCAVCPSLTWFHDSDGDTYGDPGVTTSSCTPPLGYVINPDDCNDGNPSIHPGAAELCNGIDDNCNGDVDEGGDALCDDGNVCTSDVCNGVAGCSYGILTGSCDDGTACTTGDACVSSGGCASGQSFDDVTAPALPSGWTSSVTGTGAAWVTQSTSSDSPPNSAFGFDGPAVASEVLVSPPIPIASASATLTFKNRWSFETNGTICFDAGVLEIEIGAGPFVDIVAAGGSFVSGGYTGTVSSAFNNPLGGRSAWCLSSAGYPAYLTSVVNLPSAAAGQTIRLRWRIGTDISGPGAGQNIDSITIGDVCTSDCIGSAVDCDDGNACTNDSCDPASGCLHVDITATCDDGDPCTDDFCDVEDGCVHVSNTAPCDDGDPCTSGDVCNDGVCAGSGSGDCVASVDPPNNAIDVSVGTNVTLTFRDPIYAPSVGAATFRLIGPNEAEVPANRAVSTDSTRATLDPVAALAPGTIYRVDVTSGIEGPNEEPIQPFTSYFQTGTGSESVAITSVSETTAPLPTDAKGGSSVSAAGDLNRDGIKDFVSGAPGYADAPHEVPVGAGAALVYFGSSSETERAEPDIIFTGVSLHDRAGVSVASGFDFNGDGFPDILIGAEQVDRTNPNAPVAKGNGKAYLIFFNPLDIKHYPNIGDPAFPDTVSLSLVGQPGGIPGVVFTGEGLGDQAGFAVAGGGTATPSPATDIIIGAPGADPGGQTDAGAAYVVFDNPNLSGEVPLSQIGGPPDHQVLGKAYYGGTSGDHLGFSVASGGPVVLELPNDNTVVLGAPGANNRKGKVIVPPSDPDTTPIIVDAIGRTEPGLEIEGTQDGEQLGSSVADGKDSQADGESDVLMGAPTYDVTPPLRVGFQLEVDAGRVVHMSQRLASGTYNADQVGTTIRGVIWHGATAGDQLGFAVAGLGDVTGDGFDDVAFGAPFVDPVVGGTLQADAGAIYLVNGSPVTGTLGVRSVAGIGTTYAGQRLTGTHAGDHAGSSIAGTGDLNGDGLNDFVVGAPDSDSHAGTVYMVVHSSTPAPGGCGPSGCKVVDLANGAELDVPAGGLTTNLILTVTGILDPALLPAPPPAGLTLLGAAQYSPEGQAVLPPNATIFLPTELPALMSSAPSPVFPLYRSSGGRWVLAGVDGSLVANPTYPSKAAVRATTAALGTYAVFVDVCFNVVCDDGDPCTDDACIPGSGCAYTYNEAPCDDGNPATSNDTCQAGVCAGSNCQLTPHPKSAGYYKKLCKNGHGNPSHGDALTDADAQCVGSLTATFAGFSTVDDICGVYLHDDVSGHDSNGPQGKECQKGEDELLGLAINVCRGYVCDSQRVDSSCSGDGPRRPTTVSASLQATDAILADPLRNKTTCKDARCLAKEINNGKGLHHTSLLLKKETAGKLRLSWESPAMDDGSGEASRYTIWRRVLSSNSRFMAIGVTTQQSFVDTTAGTESYEYEVTFTIRP